MTRRKSENGQVLILIVFAFIGIIGITALAVDGGNAFLEKRRTQNAADATALASALSRIKGGSWVAETFAIAEQNGFNNDGTTNVVQVYSPPAKGNYKGNVEYIQVIITNHVPTSFGKVIGINQITVQSEAISRTKTPEITEIMNGSAIISLAPTSNCTDKRSFWIHGESTLDITGGGIFVNSNNPQCALMTNGNGSIRIDGGEINVVGGADIGKSQLITPFPPLTNSIPISYPPPFFLPKVGCGQEAKILEDGETMSPGDYYDDDFPPEDVKYLKSGVYCIDNFMIGGGELHGTNVTFLVDGKIKWSGNGSINLKAPLTGDHAGLLIYAGPENKNIMVFTADDTSSTTGTILMPGAEIHLNGGGSQLGYKSQFIGYTIESSGQSNIVIKYKDEQNYDTYTMPEVQLTK